MNVSRAVFRLSGATLLYAGVGYPLLVWALSRVRPRPVARRELSDDELPTISFIISAYNEEVAIAAKLDNTFALDYPRDRLEVLAASDCSSDRTDEIVRAYSRFGNDWGEVALHRLPQRGGKTAAQNWAVERSRGEILVFSDATSNYRPDVLRALVPNFADAQVGCVGGRLTYVDPNETGVGRGARSYWGYETWLKTCESRACSLIGVSGCLYGVRRTAYRALPEDASSDFSIVGTVVEGGWRAVFEPDAVCTEETNRRVGRELSMRTRIITQTYRDLWRMRALMNPRRGKFFAVQLWSHKVLRYAAPLCLALNLLASLALARTSFLHRAISIFGSCALLSAAFGSILERTSARHTKLARVLSLPRYFLLSSLAPLLALIQIARGETYAQWQTLRDNATPNDATTRDGGDP